MTSRQLPPPANSAAVDHRQNSHLLFLGTAAAAAIFLLLTLLFIYLYFSHNRSPTPPFHSPSPPPLRRFSYRDLHAATNGFAASRSVGRGSSATVFLGVLPDGTSVAVKRLNMPPASPESSSGHREFLNELQVLSNLRQSVFVVSLLGYCFEGHQHRLIVYEYMSNGSLQDLFFGLRRPVMDWRRRFQIILDLVKGLTFLHLRDSPIIHGDIKPSNVLLDHDFRAKLSDFGLSRLKSEDKTLHIRPSCSSSSGLNHERKGKESAVSPCDDELDCIENNNDCAREWIGGEILPTKIPSLDEVYGSSHELRSQRFEDDETRFTECSNGGRKMREWWKEEYFDEINKKGKDYKSIKCFRTSNSSNWDDSSWKKKKSRSESHEMSSGDMFSEEVSRTRSMRGTVCYMAPEYSGCGNLTEKADIYNFGVLVLVIISGRRPLHVLESPMEFGRGNLVSWCRKLAQRGSVLDIVDENLKGSYDRDEVRLCIDVALLCLQRAPDLRPDSCDIVRVLEGEEELGPDSLLLNRPKGETLVDYE